MSIILARGPINARFYPLFQRMIPADIIYKYEVVRVVVVGKKRGIFFIIIHITEGRHPGWGTNCGAGGAIDEGADQQTQVLIIKPNCQ